MGVHARRLSRESSVLKVGALRGAYACTAVALALAASLIGAAAAPGASSTSRATTPPTSAEVQEATAQFIATHHIPSPRKLGELGAGVAGTGGIDFGEEAPVGPDPNAGALFPDNRVVAFYGAPQLTATIIGRKSPKAATVKLRRQARDYAGGGQRPVIPAFNLISVIATASPGGDRKYRMRQSDEVIAKYLAQARKIGGRLVLDIQPGRAKIMPEIRALSQWLAEPDVDVVIDAEWHVGRKGIPGQTLGTVQARDINRASKYLQKLIERKGLPPKLLAIHHFTSKNIRGRGKIAEHADVQVTLNFDGIGTRSAKSSIYTDLSSPDLNNGFSLFYRLDAGLMKPRQVLALDPTVDYVMYQ